MDKFQDKGFFYFFKRLLPDKLVSKKSEEHFSEFLAYRWRLVRGKKILDAGSGYGQFIAAKPNEKEVFGVDLETGNSNKTKKADLNKKIPFGNGSFDTITSFHVLEHLTNPVNAIKEFNRVLKPDGLLVLSVPNFNFRKFYADYTHVRPYPKSALYNILTQNGFSNVKILRGPHFNKILSSLFFLFPKTRWKLELFLGGIFSPYELTAIARKKS